MKRKKSAKLVVMTPMYGLVFFFFSFVLPLSSLPLFPFQTIVC